MRCHSCGGEIPDNAVFCPLCGTQVGAAPAGAQADGRGASVSYGTGFSDEAQGHASAQNPYGGAAGHAAGGAAAQGPSAAPGAQQPYGAPGNANAQNPYGAAPTSQQPYGAPQPQQPSQAAYAQGCVSAALSDIRSTDGWFKRMVFLGLVGCVPVLNFTVSGYALNWSREVPFGGRTPLPERVVTGKNFEMGFYYFVLSLVFNLVSVAASAIVGWVPLLGALLALAISLFVMVFLTLCGTRMAIMQQLGEGFKISRVWDAFKRNWSSVSGAVIGPYLVAMIAACFVSLIASVVLAVSVVLPASVASGSLLSGGFAAVLGSMGVVGLVVFVLCILLCLGIDAVAQVVIFRAVAHWVGRNAQDWVTEAYQASGWDVTR